MIRDFPELSDGISGRGNCCLFILDQELWTKLMSSGMAII
jgi:hypothetical protein